jgi:putative transposase
MVSDAEKYPWCSAGWFERTASTAFVKTVKGIQIDRVNVYDDF